MSHYPAISSVKCFAHYGQLRASGTYSRFDYGASLNEKIYGQSYPPEIDIGSISKVPIALYYGTYDKLAAPGDVRHIANHLKKEVLVDCKEFPIGHIGFLMQDKLPYFD